MKMAAAAANKPLRSKVSISIVSIIIGICLGSQFNILGSLVNVNFEGRGDPYLDGENPDDITMEQHEKRMIINTDDNEQPSYLNWQDTPP